MKLIKGNQLGFQQIAGHCYNSPYESASVADRCWPVSYWPPERRLMNPAHLMSESLVMRLPNLAEVASPIRMATRAFAICLFKAAQILKFKVD